MTAAQPRAAEQTCVGAKVCLTNLTKHFDDVVAVDHVDLEVKAGEFLTLLGPSGSGKTTTLLMVAGFQTPSEGNVFVDDDPITYQPPHKRNIGMVFQNYALFPHMTVAKNIAFPLEMRKLKKPAIEQEVERVLEIVQLAGYEQRYPRQLSGGQQQRIALARSIVFSPRILLMDEPLGALDKKLREGMQLEIKHIQERLGITVIYVTHDQEEALTMSDRIAVMNRGQIAQIGTPTDLYERPANLFVADFIGESNIFSGRVVEVTDELCAIRTPGELLLRGPRLNGVGQEDEIHFVVRPERFRLLAEGERQPNVLEGVVREMVYVGDTNKYTIETGGGETIIMKHHSLPDGPRYQRGQKVRIGWRIKDVISLEG